MELSHIICQARFPLKQVNGKFHTESKEKGDGHLGSISAHGKLFIKLHDFNPHCQLDINKA